MKFINKLGVIAMVLGLLSGCGEALIKPDISHEIKPDISHEIEKMERLKTAPQRIARLNKLMKTTDDLVQRLDLQALVTYETIQSLPTPTMDVALVRQGRHQVGQDLLFEVQSHTLDEVNEDIDVLLQLTGVNNGPRVLNSACQNLIHERCTVRNPAYSGPQLDAMNMKLFEASLSSMCGHFVAGDMARSYAEYAVAANKHLTLYQNGEEQLPDLQVYGEPAELWPLRVFEKELQRKCGIRLDAAKQRLQSVVEGR